MTSSYPALTALIAPLTQAPWWLQATAILAATTATTLHLVFSQDSADRLAWWHAWWQRPRTNPTPPQRRRRRPNRIP
jgi:hypothetical protein